MSGGNGRRIRTRLAAETANEADIFSFGVGHYQGASIVLGFGDCRRRMEALYATTDSRGNVPGGAGADSGPDGKAMTASDAYPITDFVTLAVAVGTT